MARAIVRMSPETAAAVAAGDAPKGDVLGTARIAGIQAAKRTDELIPLCHGLPLSFVGVEGEIDAEAGTVTLTTEARTRARTGVEMEALTAASVAALTVYDMVKGLGERRRDRRDRAAGEDRRAQRRLEKGARMIPRTTLLAVVAALARRPRPSADTLVVPAPGAVNLASGGGWLAWAGAAEGGRVAAGAALARRRRHRAGHPGVHRARPTRRSAPRPSAAAARTAGCSSSTAATATSSPTTPATGREAKIAGASSRTYTRDRPEHRARPPDVRAHAAARRTACTTSAAGRRRGASTAPRRRETVQNGSRVAYTSGNKVVIRRISGQGALQPPCARPRGRSASS